MVRFALDSDVTAQLPHEGHQNIMHACEVHGCGYTCKEAYQLTRHNRRHTGERPFSCEEVGCGVAYASLTALKKHLRAHERARDECRPPRVYAVRAPSETLACAAPNCNFVSHKPSALAAHFKSAGHAALSCAEPFCGQLFTNWAALFAHKRGPAHAGEGGKPLCKTCYITFDTVAEYTGHARGHRLEHLEKGRHRGAAAAAAVLAGHSHPLMEGPQARTDAEVGGRV